MSIPQKKYTYRLYGPRGEKSVTEPPKAHKRMRRGVKRMAIMNDLLS